MLEFGIWERFSEIYHLFLNSFNVSHYFSSSKVYAMIYPLYLLFCTRLYTTSMQVIVFMEYGWFLARNIQTWYRTVWSHCIKKRLCCLDVIPLLSYTYVMTCGIYHKSCVLWKFTVPLQFIHLSVPVLLFFH